MVRLDFASFCLKFGGAERRAHQETRRETISGFHVRYLDDEHERAKVLLGVLGWVTGINGGRGGAGEGNEEEERMRKRLISASAVWRSFDAASMLTRNRNTDIHRQ